MSKKFKKAEEAKNIEEVEVDVKAEVIEEALPDETAVPTVAVEDLEDRGLLEQIYFLLKDIEAKLATAPIAEAKVGKAGREKAKLTPSQKKAYKAALLAKGPYTKEELAGMKRGDLVMYAGALKLGKEKTFGKPTDVLIANILAGQKKS